MAEPINGNRFTGEQIFKIIDKNRNSVIDESDDIALAQMFGLKSGDKKIDLSKHIHLYDFLYQ